MLSGDASKQGAVEAVRCRRNGFRAYHLAEKKLAKRIDEPRRNRWSRRSPASLAAGADRRCGAETDRRANGASIYATGSYRKKL
ncbi:hypothetical protein D8O27_10110 [Burkholderia mallei]|uniref:Uncharacterized protein n=2 Tax=Burkholderia mallei TaxID=13373 RepID=A0AAX1X8T5_BURML|nr:hypothetical protein BMA2017 [Burkholderia mallei ATCC 23344]RKN98057.1 hypothetical protein D8O31_13445 [Burkholderia mallei]RKO03360.1 hypothetical protein D8O05_16310 [Burkholderia mallei]RKO03908.1 hypothetical protein D8O03_09890 [Burkholderia mallei]RKO12685.1 hypothetical protein D8O04_13745 [Burkholderia mallei]